MERFELVDERNPKKPRSNSVAQAALMICWHYWMLPDIGIYPDIYDERLPVLRNEITQYRLHSVNKEDDNAIEVARTELETTNYMPTKFISQLANQLAALSIDHEIDRESGVWGVSILCV